MTRDFNLWLDSLEGARAAAGFFVTRDTALDAYGNDCSSRMRTAGSRGFVRWWSKPAARVR